MKEEVWKDFKCKNCDGVFKIEVTVPYMGWICKWCDYRHMFKKQAKLECDTLWEVKT